MSQVSGKTPEEHEGPATFAGLKQNIEEAKDTESAFAELIKWLMENVVGHDVLPRELPEDLKPIIGRLAEGLARMRSAACEAFENFLARPAEKFMRGERLTRTEYYLLAAAGIFNEGSSKALRLSPYDDYEALDRHPAATALSKGKLRDASPDSSAFTPSNLCAVVAGRLAVYDALVHDGARAAVAGTLPASEAAVSIRQIKADAVGIDFRHFWVIERVGTAFDGSDGQLQGVFV